MRARPARLVAAASPRDMSSNECSRRAGSCPGGGGRGCLRDGGVAGMAVGTSVAKAQRRSRWRDGQEERVSRPAVSGAMADG